MMTTPQPNQERLDSSVALIVGLSELVRADRGADVLPHTWVSALALQAIYELSDDDRAALSRLTTRYRAIWDEQLTVRQVAEMFRVSPRLIKRLARAGALHGVKRKGKWVFSPRAVERYMETHLYSGGVLMVDAAEWQTKER